MMSLVSFLKLKIFSGLVFLKRFFKFSNLVVFWVNLSKLVTVYENMFDCEGYFACWAYWRGQSSLFRRCEWVMWVWSMPSLESISISSVADHSPMVSCIWWSLFCVWSSQDFCHFLNIKLLMIGFRLVYEIFILDMSARSAFLQLCLPFHFQVFQCDLVSREEWRFYF